MIPCRDPYDAFNDALDELTRLGSTGFYDVQTINSWLKKYDSLFLQCIAHPEPRYGVKLFSCNYTPFNRFWEYYDKLKDLIRMHACETYMKQQLEVYENIKHNKESVSKLLIKNKDLCMNDFFIFHSEHFRDFENGGYIRYYMHGVEYFCIDSKDFKHIIAFKHLFTKLFFFEMFIPEHEKVLESQLKYLL